MIADDICPVCKAKNAKYIGTKNYISIMACIDCTHVFADLAGKDFNHSDLDLFRDGFTHGRMQSDSDYYDHLVQGEAVGCPTFVTASKVLSMVLKTGFAHKSWLDVGSGSGHLVERAEKMDFDASGIEPGGWGQIAANRKGIRIAQGFLGENLSGRKYSIISATDVVEHVPDPIRFLSLMSSHMEEDGILIISIPCIESFEAKIFGLNWSMLSPPTHRHFFTKKSLNIAINKAGLRPLETQQYNIRRLFGLSRYSAIQRLIDKIILGDQLICMMTTERSK